MLILIHSYGLWMLVSRLWTVNVGVMAMESEWNIIYSFTKQLIRTGCLHLTIYCQTILAHYNIEMLLG